MKSTYKIIDNCLHLSISDASPISNLKPEMIGGDTKYIDLSIESLSSFSPGEFQNQINGGFYLDTELSKTDSSSLASSEINRILNKQSGGSIGKFNTELFKQLIKGGESDSYSSDDSSEINKSINGSINSAADVRKINRMRKLEEDSDQSDEDDDDDEDEDDDDDEGDDEDDDMDEDKDEDDSDETESISISKKRIQKKIESMRNKKRNLSKEDIQSDLTYRAFSKKHGLQSNSEDQSSVLSKNSLSGGSSPESASYLETSIDTNSINLIQGTRKIY